MRRLLACAFALYAPATFAAGLYIPPLKLVLDNTATYDFHVRPEEKVPAEESEFDWSIVQEVTCPKLKPNANGQLQAWIQPCGLVVFRPVSGTENLYFAVFGNTKDNPLEWPVITKERTDVPDPSPAMLGIYRRNKEGYTPVLLTMRNGRNPYWWDASDVGISTYNNAYENGRNTNAECEKNPEGCGYTPFIEKNKAGVTTLYIPVVGWMNDNTQRDIYTIKDERLVPSPKNPSTER